MEKIAGKVEIIDDEYKITDYTVAAGETSVLDDWQKTGNFRI